MFNPVEFFYFIFNPSKHLEQRIAPPFAYLLEELAREAIVTETIHPHQLGRAYYRSTWWNAYCQEDIILPEGESVRVVGISNITLVVEPKTTARSQAG
ncbi:NfeD family protein [Myxacorys almedinensis]|uniref:NfeD-like C-terminal domain-containing protein n=1 Tax=Myxacorys almedinensis A TaxID=2690445 RepID=A0A8J7Z3M1_9CYAN|nr:NfeD family protein [Myxacorys almedinensis]NDJ19134.1 hypothetical protein [Myxacorys almedinensis A]